jgi:hypothetical protein
MVRCLFVLAIALFAGAAEGQAVEPLGSVECRQALASLQAREAVIVAARQAGAPFAPDASLQSLRRQAARACLGSRADSPPSPQRVVRPPVVVPPIVVARPAPPPQMPVLPSLKPIEPNLVVTTCDAVGCWASDGSRLQRVGPNLLGPRGLCSVQGTLLHCP